MRCKQAVSKCVLPYFSYYKTLNEWYCMCADRINQKWKSQYMVLLSFYLACIVLYDAILLLYQMSAINPIQYTIQYHKNVTVHVQGVHIHVLVVLSFFYRHWLCCVWFRVRACLCICIYIYICICICICGAMYTKIIQYDYNMNGMQDEDGCDDLQCAAAV